MVRHGVLAVLALVVLSLLLLLFPGGEIVSQELREVFVLNFPEVQEIEGTVAVKGPVHLARSTSIQDITVAPVARGDSTRLVDAGVLEFEGFPNVILSLQGVVKGRVQKAGAVGVLLIPDVPTIQEAFVELGVMHFFLETVASSITAQTPYFASDQPRYQVAFPRYRVLLYNTTDKTVNANLFAYLTN